MHTTGGYRSIERALPGIIISNQLFELDRDRYTRSGGVASSMDMTLQLIAREPDGVAIAARAAGTAAVRPS